MAYMLNSLAAAQGHEGGRNNRDIILEVLSREQVEYFKGRYTGSLYIPM
ncbi:hypothetical protein ACTXPD_18525 [Vreelandella alkaliphila]